MILMDFSIDLAYVADSVGGRHMSLRIIIRSLILEILSGSNGL